MNSKTKEQNSFVANCSVQSNLRGKGNLYFRILPNSGISASKWDLFVFRKHTPSCVLHDVFLDKQTGISLPQTDRPSSTRLITRFYITIALNKFCLPVQHLTYIFASSMQNCHNDYCWFLAYKGKGFLFFLSLFQGFPDFLQKQFYLDSIYFNEKVKF